MANTPASIAARQRAQGIAAGICLLEIQTLTGLRGYYSTAPIVAPSVLSSWDGSTTTAGVTSWVYGQSLVSYLPWIVAPPRIKLTGSLASNTGTVTLQNVSGNTVERDMSKLLSKNALTGAIAIFRYWDPVAEFALFTFNAKVELATPEDQTFLVDLVSRMNFSTTKAPSGKIGPNCNLTFGSDACGSTSSTPCNNTWGTCSQTNRFAGFVQQWSTASTLPAVDAFAQPVQPIEINGRIAS